VTLKQLVLATLDQPYRAVFWAIIIQVSLTPGQPDRIKGVEGNQDGVWGHVVNYKLQRQHCPHEIGLPPRRVVPHKRNPLVAHHGQHKASTYEKTCSEDGLADDQPSLLSLQVILVVRENEVVDFEHHGELGDHGQHEARASKDIVRITVLLARGEHRSEDCHDDYDANRDDVEAHSDYLRRLLQAICVDLQQLQAHVGCPR